MRIPFSADNLYHWLDQRLGLGAMKLTAEKKVVPVHRHSFWYYMGGIILMFIAVQLVTGILLMVYYIPEVKSAHNSILTIRSLIDFGWFIRSMHAWGANLVILVLFLHLFSTYFMKAYRSPRELTWWSGLLLFALMFGFGFSGYLLPWDEVSFFATKIGIDIAATLPLIGEQTAQLLRGGDTIGQGTLSRFFTLHVIVLPLLLLPVLGLHLFLIQRQGNVEPESFKALPESQRGYEKFFPNFALKDAMGWLAVLNLMAVLTVFYPWGIGPEADPFKPAPAGIKPEWYFLFLFQLLRIMPSRIGPFEGEHVAMVLFTLVLITLVAIPLWDRGDQPRHGRRAMFYGLVLTVLFIILTLWGMLS